MSSKGVLWWNTRLSLLYAFGIWTMLGSIGYMKFSGHLEDASGKKEEEIEERKEEKEAENLRQAVHDNGYFKTVVVYKKDFVPYSTRISNFISRFRREPGTEDK
ncbi:small integral membrane protein 26-like [Antennarius striatus]|uniref:small integral membrane protein 26-like n=1 Tax=Antennarius striatus TaxID=241820 RepID=UPI0035B4F15E